MAVATERSKIELAQREINKKNLAETGDVVPASAKRNMRMIVHEEMTATKEMVVRGEQRHVGRRWAETRRI